MDNNLSIQDLQIASDFIVMKRHLNLMGVFDIVIGTFLVILLSVFSIQSGELYLLSIGILLITTGILSIIKTSPVMIFIDILPWIGLLVSAIILKEDIIGKIQGSLITLGFIFITNNLYQRFRQKVPRKPAPEAMAIMDQAIEFVEMRDISAFNDIIEMNWGTMKWRVYLGEEVSVLFDPSRSPISVLDRDKDLLAPRSRTDDTQMVGVTNEAKKDLYLHISDEHYQRYLAWKGTPAG